MCGRFVRYSDTEVLADYFGAEAAELLLEPAYNIAPSSLIPAVRKGDNGRELVKFKWGLLPSWSKTESGGYKLINARADSINTKPFFRMTFQKQRCLIPANGFYEWHAHETGKQPFFIHLLNSEIFAFAGLWECWESAEGDKIQTCAIITTEPNAVMARIHNRMPVILDPSEYDNWLDTSQTRTDLLLGMLDPYPADEMEIYPVTTRVNNPRNQGSGLIEIMELL